MLSWKVRNFVYLKDSRNVSSVTNDLASWLFICRSGLTCMEFGLFLPPPLIKASDHLRMNSCLEKTFQTTNVLQCALFPLLGGVFPNQFCILHFVGLVLTWGNRENNCFSQFLTMSKMMKLMTELSGYLLEWSKKCPLPFSQTVS